MKVSKNIAADRGKFTTGGSCLESPKVNIGTVPNLDRNNMRNPYETKYDQESYYWGVRPSPICFEVLKLMPPHRPLKLLDIGCGEGRNAVFFARNGYEASAFDLSEKGIGSRDRRCFLEIKS